MKNITYTINTTITATSKTPQITQLIAALTEAFGDREFKLDETSVLGNHGLKTKQDPTRIFAYYQNDLITLGVLVKHVTVTETEKKNTSRIATIRELAAKIANDVAISDESRVAANAILDLTK